jgi:3-hydroxymyristoyl/3-hydroxydecanoyl-(acyl carrier protein) dehydratase
MALRRVREAGMALATDFVADCPYGPGGLLLDEVVEIDREKSRVVGRMPTHDDLPLTREQRAHPTRHPRHVSGGLMVHMTGMMGFVHAYYVLELRHSVGWIGYGGRIHSARFRALARPGPPMLLECEATRMRRTPKSVLARYSFRFTQEGELVYEGDQTALWSRVEPS